MTPTPKAVEDALKEFDSWFYANSPRYKEQKAFLKTKLLSFFSLGYEEGLNAAVGYIIQKSEAYTPDPEEWTGERIVKSETLEEARTPSSQA